MKAKHHRLLHLVQCCLLALLLVHSRLGWVAEEGLTECAAYERMGVAFASRNTVALQELQLRLPAHLGTDVQAAAVRLLEVLERLEKGEAEQRQLKDCRHKAYTGENLDELLPQLIKHYNISQLLTPKFWEDAASVPERVNSRYNTDGVPLIPSWQKYHLVDISDCDELTPECLIWKHPSVNTSEHPTDRTYRKCCIEHRRLLETLTDVLARMEEVGIQPWLGMGSLLAAVRHNGAFIGWDTDVDLYIREEDEELFRKAFKNSRTSKHWFAIDPQTDQGSQKRDMYYIYYTRKRTKGGSHVEVWVWNNRRMNVSRFNGMLFPLQPCQLYDLTVFCPKDPERMLQQWYGNSWWRYRFTMGRDTVMLT